MIGSEVSECIDKEMSGLSDGVARGVGSVAAKIRMVYASVIAMNGAEEPSEIGSGKRDTIGGTSLEAEVKAWAERKVTVPVDFAYVTKYWPTRIH